MKNTIHYVVILACLIVTFFLYNKQMGSIPLLILSIYLFYFGWLRVRESKNNKSR
ncbi:MULTISPECIES: hypothetical protein [Paenisporosarcina]|jgi:hypothetical protein|uniref:Uncharacterized protein n=1 Tax=Paenisporosarcina quisquiliarum TaxID=365346 RepID=A0A9X3RE77_9BACL|nr:hypothetical protein [Paenisporosarcina quisquiliarum]MCZ8538605.1 hypothetical protein [Paenisporosarcina quisquiliarum]